MTHSTPNEVPSLNLRCPYCEGTLRPIYIVGNRLEGFECITGNCNADWDETGNLVGPPLWSTHPDLYPKPDNIRDNN